eukprot:11788818-Heterocapsa_arctica.AAC.1
MPPATTPTMTTHHIRMARSWNLDPISRETDRVEFYRRLAAKKAQASQQRAADREVMRPYKEKLAAKKREEEKAAKKVKKA